MVVRRYNPSDPKHTSNLILPNGLIASLTTRGVFVVVSRHWMEGSRFKKQHSYITSTGAPWSTYCLRTVYPSTYASTIRGSLETSPGNIGGKLIRAFIQSSSWSMTFHFRPFPWYRIIFVIHPWLAWLLFRGGLCPFAERPVSDDRAYPSPWLS